jgi:hypothetical protein
VFVVRWARRRRRAQRLRRRLRLNRLQPLLVESLSRPDTRAAGAAPANADRYAMAIPPSLVVCSMEGA